MVSVLVRMTEEDREVIRAAAVRAGQKMAPWALEVLRREALLGVGAGARGPREAGGEAGSTSVRAVKQTVQAVVKAKEVPPPAKGIAAPHGPQPCAPHCGKLHAHQR